VRHQPDLVRRLHVLTSIGSAVPTWVMDAKEAADFMRISESEFKRMAPGLPRHAVTERRYIYPRSELLTWLLGRQRRRVASSASSRKAARRRTTRYGVVSDRCQRGRRRLSRRGSSARYGGGGPLCSRLLRQDGSSREPSLFASESPSNVQTSRSPGRSEIESSTDGIGTNPKEGGPRGSPAFPKGSIKMRTPEGVVHKKAECPK
jgi:hypothetical protein